MVLGRAMWMGMDEAFMRVGVGMDQVMRLKEPFVFQDLIG